jgi:hypothetical protein
MKASTISYVVLVSLFFVGTAAAAPTYAVQGGFSAGVTQAGTVSRAACAGTMTGSADVGTGTSTATRNVKGAPTGAAMSAADCYSLLAPLLGTSVFRQAAKEGGAARNLISLVPPGQPSVITNVITILDSNPADANSAGSVLFYNQTWSWQANPNKIFVDETFAGTWFPMQNACSAITFLPYEEQWVQKVGGEIEIYRPAFKYTTKSFSGQTTTYTAVWKSTVVYPGTAVMPGPLQTLKKNTETHTWDNNGATRCTGFNTDTVETASDPAEVVLGQASFVPVMPDFAVAILGGVMVMMGAVWIRRRRKA